MISNARSDTTHPVQSNADISPLYWVASSVNDTSFFFQVANIDSSPVPFTATIQNIARSKPTSNSAKATATILAAAPGQPANVTNSLALGQQVVPKVQSVQVTKLGQNLQFSGTIPGGSFSVYRVDI